MSNSSKQASPPGWAMNFLKWFCPAELVEGIVADLEEQFEDDLEKVGLKKARRGFTRGVVRFLHPSILFRRKVKKLRYINMDMYKSYLLVVIRSMMRYKFYSLINVVGLALAVAFIFLSYLFVESELRYDQFNTNKSHIYRLYRQTVDIESGSVDLGIKPAIVPIPLGAEIANQVPSVKSFCRIASNRGTVLQSQTPYDQNIHFADEDFFSVFDFPIISGSKRTALVEPNSVLLSLKLQKSTLGLMTQWVRHFIS